MDPDSARRPMFWLPVSHQTIKFGFMSQNKTQGFFQRFQFLLPQQKRGGALWFLESVHPATNPEKKYYRAKEKHATRRNAVYIMIHLQKSIIKSSSNQMVFFSPHPPTPRCPADASPPAACRAWRPGVRPFRPGPPGEPGRSRSSEKFHGEQRWW